MEFKNKFLLTYPPGHNIYDSYVVYQSRSCFHIYISNELHVTLISIVEILKGQPYENKIEAISSVITIARESATITMFGKGAKSGKEWKSSIGKKLEGSGYVLIGCC